jgi:peptidoglycan/LPS O-acetylase OafA/YrhL
LPFLVLHSGLLAPVWILAIYTLASGAGMTSRWLASRPMLRLGEASYALYLVHSPFDSYLRELTERGLFPPLPAGRGLAIYLVLAVLFSLALFRWLENPARKFIRQRSVARSGRAAVAAIA